MLFNVLRMSIGTRRMWWGRGGREREAFHHVFGGCRCHCHCCIFFCGWFRLFVSSFKHTLLCVYFIVTIFDYTIDRWLLLSLLLLLFVLLLSCSHSPYSLFMCWDSFLWGAQRWSFTNFRSRPVCAVFFPSSLHFFFSRCAGRYASLYIFILLYYTVYVEWNGLSYNWNTTSLHWAIHSSRSWTVGDKVCARERESQRERR